MHIFEELFVVLHDFRHELKEGVPNFDLVNSVLVIFGVSENLESEIYIFELRARPLLDA